MSPSYFESICVRDGQPRLLHLHQARLWKTMGSVGPGLEELLAPLIPPSRGVFKVRIDYNLMGDILSCDISPYTPRPISSLALVECPDLDYSLKSTDRSALEQARQSRREASDVIITQDGFLTDTTYSNLVFGDGSRWVTPAHCLLPGIKRQYLLEAGAITASPLRAADIGRFPFCSLINAMLDPGDVLIPTSAIIL